MLEAPRSDQRDAKNALLRIDRRRLILFVIGYYIYSCHRLDFVSDGPVSFQPLLIHPRKHSNLCIHVIEHSHDLLPVVDPMKTPDVLLERAAPRDRHREKQSVESGVVEALADVASSGKQDTRVSVGNRGELFRDGFSLLLSHSAFQDQYALSVR